MAMRSGIATRRSSPLSRVSSAAAAKPPAPKPPPRSTKPTPTLEDIPEDIDIPPQPIAADADAEGLGFLSDLQGLPDINSVSLLGDVLSGSSYSVTNDAMYGNLSSLPGPPHGVAAAGGGVAEGVARHLRGSTTGGARPVCTNPGDSFMASMYGGSMPHPTHGPVSGPIGFATQMFERSQAVKVTASQFRGVTRPLFHASWDAHIPTLSGEPVFLGSFSCEEMAARAYDVAVLKLSGVKTNLNFDASEYDERGLAQMKDVPAEELVSALIQQSKSAHSRSSKFRGVWSTDEGKFECKYVLDDD